jgi:hypothetical protein
MAPTRAHGGKYYIGNANKAAMVSTFGKMADGGENAGQIHFLCGQLAAPQLQTGEKHGLQPELS